MSNDPTRGPYYRQENPAFRTALVYAIESVPPYRVRVQFPERDNVISYWLPVQVPKIMNDKFFWQPDINEQVCVLMDENDENGIVLGSVPSQADQAPAGLTPAQFYIGFEDGTILQYNRTTHQLTVSLGTGGQAVLSTDAGGSITLDPSGNIEFKAAGSITFAQGGESVADSLVLVSKFLAAFNAHTHGAVPDAGPPPTVPLIAMDVSSSLVKVSD